MDEKLLDRLRHIKCVYCDIDGTIIHDDRSISARTKKVARKLMNLGYIFGLISGRHYLMAFKQIKALKTNGLYVGSNGSLIVNQRNEIIDKTPIKSESIKPLIHWLIENNYAFWFFTERDLYYFSGQKRVYRDLVEHSLDDVFSSARPIEIVHYNEFLHIYHQIFCLVVISDQDERIDKVFNQFKNNSEFNFHRESGLLEVQSSASDKGRGIEKIADFYHLTLSEIMVFGDSYNDIPMLKKAGFSIVMQQAKDEIKRYAHYILDLDNNNDGVADFIERHLLK